MISHKHVVKLIGQMQDSSWVKKKTQKTPKKDTRISIWSGIKTILVLQKDGDGLSKTVANNKSLQQER